MKQGLLLIIALTVAGLLAACSASANQSQAAQPEVIQPQAAQPEIVQPQAIQPQAIQPEATQPQAPQIETAQAQPAAPVLETQWNDEQAVRVEVTPLNLPQGGSSLDFTVAFETHSVDLSFDPVAISLLRDDAGREYPALEWQGDGPGGHHRSGVLRFKGLDPSVQSVEVVIRDVAGVPERVFRWDLTEK